MMIHVLLLFCIIAPQLVYCTEEIDDPHYSVRNITSNLPPRTPAVFYVFRCAAKQHAEDDEVGESEDESECNQFRKKFEQSLHAVELKLKILKTYVINCAKFDTNDMTHDSKYCDELDEFHTRLIYDSGSTIEEPLSTQNAREDTHPQTIYSDVLRHMTREFKNFHRIYTKYTLEDMIFSSDPAVNKKFDDEFLLCYSEEIPTTISDSFCYEIGLIFQKNNTKVLHTTRKTVLADIQLLTGADNMKTNYSFGLWLMSCFEADELDDCKVYKYYGKPDLLAITSFWNCAKLPGVTEMTSDGHKSQFYDDNQCNLLYMLHESSFVDIFSQAHAIISKLRGSVSVVMLNVGKAKMQQVKKYASDKELDTVTDGPIFKLHLISSYKTGKRTKELLAISGNVVEYIRNVLIEKANLDFIVEQDSKGNIVPAPTRSTTYDDEEVQDDAVENILFKLRISSEDFHSPPDHRMVNKLNETNFEQFINKKPYTFILYWLNVDTMSRAVFYLWGLTSNRLYANSTRPRVMGAVACNDWIDICENNLANSWPRIFIYNNGKLVKEYNGVFDETVLASFILLHEVDAPMNLPSMASVLAVQSSKLSTLSPVFNHVNISATTIGLFRDCNTAGTKVFSDIAQQLRGRYVLAMGCGQVFHSWSKNVKSSKTENAIITTFRPNDPIKSESKFEFKIIDGQLTAEPENIVQFIIYSSRPILIPLNDYTSPTIMSSGKVPIVFVDFPLETKSPEFHTIGQIALDKSFGDQFCFTYLEKKDSNNSTKELLKTWGVSNADIPALVVIDTINGKAHRLVQLKQLEDEKINDWLKKVVEGDTQNFASLPNHTFGDTIMKHDHLGYLYGTPGLKEKEYYAPLIEEPTETEESPEPDVLEGKDVSNSEHNKLRDPVSAMDEAEAVYDNNHMDDHVEL